MKTIKLNFWILFFIAALSIFIYIFTHYKISMLIAHPLVRLSPWTARQMNNLTEWQPEAQSLLYDESLARKEVWAYVDKHSIAPGESFYLMVSTIPGSEARLGSIAVARIGRSEKKYLWHSPKITLKAEDISATAFAIGAGWSSTLKIEETKEWKSGYYAIDFIKEDNSVIPDIAYIIVINPRMDADILIKFGTNTYQAYNRWGGASLYDEGGKGKAGHIVSFDRPTPPDFYRWDYYLVKWIEELAQNYKFTVDYATNFDIHSNRRFMEKYPLVIISGHDEYWSHEEYVSTYERIFKTGKNTMLFGGNIGYYNVRYSDVNSTSENLGRQLISYKSKFDPIALRPAGDNKELHTNRFDAIGLNNRNVFGLEYSGWFQPQTASRPGFEAYSYSPPELAFLKLPYAKGEAIGKLIGYEWDSVDEKSKVPLPSIFPQIKQIIPVFYGSAIDKSGEPRQFNSVYFESEAGAKVFSA
ncbi:MAG: N,N-dimethylformamidase beta subunit family domain-containing protein, partial [Candidatus Methylumidiphilus sp.]